MKLNIYKAFLITLSFVISNSAFSQHCPSGQVEVFFNLTGTTNGNVPYLGLDTDKDGSPDTWYPMYDADNTGSTGTDGWFQCAVCLAENTQHWYIYRDATGAWEGTNLLADFSTKGCTNDASWEGNPCYDCPIRGNHGAGFQYAQRVLDVGIEPVNVHETIGECPSARNAGDGAYTHYETRNIQVLPAQSGMSDATDRVHNADGWVSFWKDVNNTPTDFSDDYIMMAIDGTSFAYWNLQFNRARINAPTVSRAQWYANDPSTFINNPAGGSARLQRTWSYTWTNALANPVGVRFYYTDAEFNSINYYITDANFGNGIALNDATEMQVYKVTSNEYAWDIANLSSSDVAVLSHNSTPSTTEFLAATNGTDVNYVEFEVDAFGNTGFNGGGIVGTSGGIAVPVELVKFEGRLQEQNVLLEWATFSEIENDYFRIEHSLDGVVFTAIGEVDGNGNSIEIINYEFVHEAPSNGVNYYRLVDVAFDGTKGYSPVISVALEQDGKLSVFPTLTSNLLNINCESDAIDVLIYNQIGMEMMRQNLQLNNNTQTLLVADLPNGVYFLIVEDGNNRQTVKFVKQ